MQPIEGITPTMLWNFGYVMLAVIAVIISVEKIPDIVWKWKDRKKKAAEAPQASFADEVCTKVMNKVEPKFDDVYEKLGADKARLDSHELMLNHLSKSMTDTSEGFSVLCYAMIAVLNHGIHNGNKDEMESALGRLHEYLSKRNIAD